MRRFAALLIALSMLLVAPSAWAADVVDTDGFGTLLEKYVDANGQVDYAAWHESKKDRARLDAFLDEVAKAKPDTRSKKAQLAFYINAYNAVVLDSVLDKWPVKSVMKEDGFFKKQEHTVADKKLTLDALKHKLIRPRFKEPRIHFVLVCAAKSCPRLRQTPMTEKNLEASLEAAAKEFIPKATKVSGKKVTTSQLFNWFSDDFKAAEGSVEAYLAKYVDGKAKKVLESGEAKVEFSEYDWAINEQ
ncbi:MAG: DUF547 domain-containing protein [Persicimonas sp.]